MKETNLKYQTKYYKKYFDCNKKDFEYKEIPLNKENWWYVQIDASIRYCFLKYNVKLPTKVTIQFCTGYTYINIFRAPLNTLSQIKNWEVKYEYIMDELIKLAELNSITENDTEDKNKCIIYKFKIL